MTIFLLIKNDYVQKQKKKREMKKKYPINIMKIPGAHLQMVSNE